jgi:hypothetical protein
LRRASILATAALAAIGAMMLAGPGLAQTSAGQSGGPRYLSWPGRGEAVMPAPERAEATPVRRDLRRPNTPIPHGGFALAEPAPARPGLTPAPGPIRHALTPANAWLHRPAPPPEAAPAPEPAPAPAPVMTAAPPPSAPRAAPPPAPAPRAAAPDYLMDRSGQPAPAESVLPPAPVPAPETVPAAGAADPMAPRRDAPIFRMQRNPPPPAATPEPAPPEAEEPEQADRDAPRPHRIAEVVNTGERPPQQGARYYSVHRQNGRHPDALEMPAPTYVDALAITMTETPASQDLAQPDQGPTLIRDNQGRLRATPAASDGDHQ